MTRRRHRAHGGVSISPNNHVPTASDASSDRSTPPPSDNGSSDTEANYFAQYEGFVENPLAGFISNFNRLAIDEKWSKKQKKKHRAEAVEYEVARHYGTDTTKLEKWQDLCKEVLIKDIPQSITKCKKALAGVYVNIFNLIDHRRNPERFEVMVFPNYQKFRKYTLNGRIYPLNLAKQDTFIKALLRPIHF